MALESVECGPILEQGGPVRGLGGGPVPFEKVFGYQVMNSGGICEQSLLDLKAMKGVQVCVFLEDGGYDSLELPLFPEGLPVASGFADLASKVQAESTVQAIFDFVKEGSTEAGSAYHVQRGRAPK